MGRNRLTMKKLLFFLLISTVFLTQGFSQVASQLITANSTPVDSSVKNFVFVDKRPGQLNRMYLAKVDSLRLFPWNVRWLNDTIITVGNLRYAQLAASYSNPSFVNTLSAGKVFGLSNVATTGNYSDLSGLPNLSQFYLSSNPSGYITGITSGDIFAALGYIPYDGNSNPNGYINQDNVYNADLGIMKFGSEPTATFIADTLMLMTVSRATDSIGALVGMISGKLNTLDTTNKWKNINYSPSGSEIISGLGFMPLTQLRTLTINGNTQDISVNRTWNVGTLIASDTNSLSTRINTKQNQLSGTGFVKVSGASISYDNSNYLTSYTETDPLFDTKFSGKTTTNLIEGTNLYWNSTRSNNALTSTAINTAIGGTILKASDTSGKWLSSSTVIPAQYNPSAGVGISITGSYPNQTITNSLASPTVNNTVARTLNSNYTISPSRNTSVSYALSLSVTNPLLIGSSSANAFLEYSTNAGSSWTIVNQVSNTSSVGITVTVAITNIQTSTLTGYIPANALVRLRSTTSGTASVTYVTGQETLF